MKYRNLWLKLLLSFVISVLFIFSGTDSLSYIIQGKYFFSDLLVSITLVFVLLTYIPAVISYLDREYKWQERPFTRLSWHLIAGVLLPALFVFLFMYTYFFVFHNFKPEEIRFFYTEFPFSVIVIIAVNIAFTAIVFYRDSARHHQKVVSLKQQLFTLQNAFPQTSGNGTESAKSSAAGPASNEEIFKPRTFIAVAGKKNIPIPVDEISCFFKDGNYTRLKTFRSNTYLLTHTLDELMSILDEGMFFRVNRQFIVNRKACDYFTNEDNGKLGLFLSPPHEEEVIISQKRAPVFRDWINS